MTLRELLLVISLFVPIVTALGAGWHQNGMHGIVVGLLVGLPLGVACVCGTNALYAGTDRLIDRSTLRNSNWQIAVWILMLVGIGVWLIGMTAVAATATEKFSGH